MDGFKIVATQERQGVYFSVVPHQWETNGILFWPEHLGHSPRETLRSNGASKTEGNWKEYPCVVKCSGVSTFKEALSIEKQLTQCIDTDAEEALFEDMHCSKKRNRNKPTAKHLTGRNDMFAQFSGDAESMKPKINVISQEMVASSQDQLLKTVVVGPDGTIDLNCLNEATAITPSSEELRLLRNEITDLKDEFANFKLEIKTQIKEEYSKINLNLDRIFRVLSTQDQPRPDIAPKSKKVDKLENVKFPLTSCEEISSLEDEIRNDVEFRAQLIEFLSKIGGCTGIEDGTKLAYKVVDYMFQSEVLLKYSWTGVSRGTSAEKKQKKKSFQVLDGILGVFFEVISLADNRHTHKKNCTIFKDGVLKHAKKRSERKCGKKGAVPTNELVPKDARNNEPVPEGNTVDVHGTNDTNNIDKDDNIENVENTE